MYKQSKAYLPLKTTTGNDNLGKLSQCSFFLISALILVLQKAVIYIGSNNYALVIR